MRKQVFGRQLQRDINERRALLKSLMTSLIVHERIQTTQAKAKAMRGQIETLVTKAKMGGVEATRQLQPYFSVPVLKKLLNDVAPRFANRPGGYTRIINLDNRLRDNAKMVVMEWVVTKQEDKNDEQGESKKALVTEKVQATVVSKTKKKPTSTKAPAGKAIKKTGKKTIKQTIKKSAKEKKK